MDKKAEKKITIVGAVGFMLIAVIGLISNIFVRIAQNQNGYKIEFTNTICLLLNVGIYVAFAAILMIRKMNMVPVVVSGVNLIHGLYHCIKYFNYASVLSALSSLIVLIIVMNGCIPVLKEKMKITKYIWFLPGALTLLIGIIYTVLFAKSTINLLEYNSTIIWLKYWLINSAPQWIAYLFPGIGYICMGLWFKKVEEKELDMKTEKATPIDLTVNNQIIFGGAEKIKSYKELLDSGVITEEEFKEKKNKIIG